MSKKSSTRPENWPDWYNAGTINEAIFCQQYLANHKLVFTENTFFTPEGKLTDG